MENKDGGEKTRIEWKRKRKVREEEGQEEKNRR